MDDGRSTDDLIEIAEGLPDDLGLVAEMDAIRGVAKGRDISLAVNLNGRLVELELGDEALGQGPHRLAAEISRLSSEACKRAQEQAMLTLKVASNPTVAADIDEQPMIDAAPKPPAPIQPPQPEPARRPEAKQPRQPEFDLDEEEFGSVMVRGRTGRREGS